jgi:hypothetical protein
MKLPARAWSAERDTTSDDGSGVGIAEGRADVGLEVVYLSVGALLVTGFMLGATVGAVVGGRVLKSLAEVGRCEGASVGASLGILVGLDTGTSEGF